MPTPMPFHRHLRALFAAGLCGASTAPALTLQAQWEVADYRAEEFAPNGFRLNADLGWLRGPALALEQGFGGWRVGARAQALSGALHYRGMTQFGVPLRTSTSLQLQRAELSVAPQAPWPLGPLDLQAGAALGMLRIERAIHATAISLPTTETLSSRYAALDAEIGWRTAAIDWRAGITVQRPLRERLAVDTFGFFDPYRLHPDARWSGGLQFEAAFVPAPRWRIGAQVTRRWMRFGAAPARLVTRDGVPAGISAYPGSRQTLDSLSLGVGHAF